MPTLPTAGRSWPPGGLPSGLPRGTVGGRGTGRQTPGAKAKTPRPKVLPRPGTRAEPPLSQTYTRPDGVTVIVNNGVVAGQPLPPAPTPAGPRVVVKSPTATKPANGSSSGGGKGVKGRSLRDLLVTEAGVPVPAVVPGALAAEPGPDLQVGISGSGSLFGLPPIVLAAAGIGLVFMLTSGKK